VRGTSHDTSGIIRISYGSPEFVALAILAYKDCPELERRSDLQLVNITGGIVFLPRGGPTPSSDFTSSLDTDDTPHELLGSTEVNRRWPGFKIPDGVDAAYTADMGIFHASKSVTAMQHQARANSAVLEEKTQVGRVIPSADGVVIETTSGQYRAGKLI
jgi:sarcosine oxidase